MKHLYIIGNGFDIYTGLATRYSDFRLWLENNYPFIYENCRLFMIYMLSGYSEIPNDHCFIKLTVFKYMLNMFAYIRFARLVNIC